MNEPFWIMFPRGLVGDPGPVAQPLDLEAG